MRTLIRKLWGKYTRIVAGLRRCERCEGAGPCLWDYSQDRYLCRGCHGVPYDHFFIEQGRLLKRKLRFWRLWKRLRK